MKKVTLLALLALFLLSVCTLLPRPTQERKLSTPAPTTAASEETTPCAPENWGIVITSIEQTNLGGGKKLIFAKIGIENNDSLWGKVTGPKAANEKTTESVFLTTEDGSSYEYSDSSGSIPLEQLSAANQRLYEATGHIETPLLPPDYVTLGKTVDGETHYYNFAFLIPESQTPDSITIGNMGVDCIQPHVLSENGKPSYRKKSTQLPTKTYKLDTDLADVRDAPSARRYPNLVGAELVTPDWKETIFITDVTRDGNTITVTFDFTNFSSHAVSPSFEGYIMGDGQISICQNGPVHGLVESGQTAQDLTWTFIIPEDETDPVFVYVYGGTADLNEVYRVNPEG